MTSSLIGLPDARDRVYRYYGIANQPAPRGYFRTAIASVGTGASRVASAIASVPQRIDRAVSRVTGIDLAWSSACLTIGSVGSAFAYREPFRASAAFHFHDRLGHLDYFRAVNETIDSVRGKNHRLKYGHTIFWLPSLVQKHGVIAVPGYAVHILQDFTTVAGIPVIPGARLAAIGLRKVGLRAPIATGLVTVNLAGAIGVVSAGLLAYEVATIGCDIYRQIRRKSHARRLLDPRRTSELVAELDRAVERLAPEDAATERPDLCHPDGR